jgi:hypothetical protein
MSLKFLYEMISFIKGSAHPSHDGFDRTENPAFCILSTLALKAFSHGSNIYTMVGCIFLSQGFEREDRVSWGGRPANQVLAPGVTSWRGHRQNNTIHTIHKTSNLWTAPTEVISSTHLKTKLQQKRKKEDLADHWGPTARPSERHESKLKGLASFLGRLFLTPHGTRLHVGLLPGTDGIRYNGIMQFRKNRNEKSVTCWSEKPH